MQPNWILTEDEVKLRKEKRKKIKVVEVHINLESLADQTLAEVMLSLARFYDKHPKLYQEVAMAKEQGLNLSFHSLKLLDKFVHNTFAAVLLETSGRKDLSPDDQRQLIVCNSPLINSFVHSLFYKANEVQLIQAKYNEVVSHNDDLRHRAYKGPRGIDYHQLYSSPWSPSIEVEVRHENLTRKMSDWCPRIDSELDLLPTVLMLYILLFSTEFLDLQHPEQVAKSQLHFIHLLQSYVKRVYPQNAGKKMVDGMLLISWAREAQEIRRKRLPV